MKNWYPGSRSYRLVGGFANGQYHRVSQRPPHIDFVVPCDKREFVNGQGTSREQMFPTQRYILIPYKYVMFGQQLLAWIYLCDGLRPDGPEAMDTISNITRARAQNFCTRKSRNVRQQNKWDKRQRRWIDNAKQRGRTWAIKHKSSEFINGRLKQFHSVNI